jgi:hypothetical protein
MAAPITEAPLAPPPEALDAMPAPAAMPPAPVMAPVMPAPVFAAMPAPSVPLVAAPPPVHYDIVSGFGTDIPLALAMRQIVPARYSYSFDSTVDPGVKINWKGGQPWDAVLNNAVAPLGFAAKVAGDTVFVYDQAKRGRDFAAMGAVPAVPAPMAPAASSASALPGSAALPPGGPLVMDTPLAAPGVPSGPDDDGMASLPVPAAPVPVVMVPPPPPQEAIAPGFVSKYPPQNQQGFVAPAVAPRRLSQLSEAEIRGDNYHPSYPRRNPALYFKNSELATAGATMAPETLPADASPVVVPAPGLMVAPPPAAVPSPVGAAPLPYAPPGPSAMLLPPSSVPQQIAAPPVVPGGNDGMTHVLGAPQPLAPAPVTVPPAAMIAPPALPAAMNVASAASTMPVPPPPAPPSVAPAAYGSPSVLHPYDVNFWQAASGASLKETLSSWSAEAGVSLLWSADRDFRLPAQVGMHGTYSDAISATLMAFADAHPQPVAQLYPNLPSGPSVLVVKSR